ncbi:MAG: MBL fold metallo-hydrolase [Bacteroidales bacterium]|nr:MBL fold metallo-hydrolase [Bacteroidales bacterium]MBD5282441.1 MBL fold metallo-hydrolase [Bacteroides sp.]MDE6427970.1 MBL fold metallo-hydrolase [Muribaculaceae bacterium]MBD5293389.1 MBL fold metallo-hydrolase [Bacteroides sp.]MBD5361044.1 MBL fold metallo-hydrolase [Bacteroides sp.]
MTTKKSKNSLTHPDSGHPELFSAEQLGETPLIRAQKAAEEQALRGRMETLRFMSFGSGSSGNCSYIGDDRSGFLIDAGVEGAVVENALKAQGIPMTHVKGILLTHDHGDHVRYVYSLLRNHRHLLVYCTPRVLNGMLRRHSMSRRVKDYHRAIYKEFEFTIGNFTITPFEVMHDGSDNCGFHIRHGETTMAVATDLGCISDRVDHYFTDVNFMVIESNYDRQMLLTGPYPDYLKARIEHDNGHLDNQVSADFVARKWHPGLRYVFLCHLSNDNNTPAKSVEAHRKSLAAINPGLRFGSGEQENLTDIEIIALPRFEPTPLYFLRKKI